MKILIAPDSFKDSLSAREVGKAVERGLRAELPESEIKILPMADGGEGTVEALSDATGGKIFSVDVFDPLMRKISASFGLLGDGNTAVIEMADASGIELLKPEERNPWVTTTYGTGQLISGALDKGCKKIIIGIGGSATNDAGAGMARALGVRFYDKNNNEAGTGGGNTGEISRIDTSGMDERIKNCEIIVACDVTNPLTGKQGASYVYGAQKGADQQMIAALDIQLKHFARVIKSQLNIDIEHVQGAGAAGGLGAGLMAFLDAKLRSGFDIVRIETRLDEHVKWADMVITGEGKLDSQTQYGKTPMGVCKVAKKHKKPVIALSGTLGEGYQELYPLGFDGIVSILDKPMDLKEALKTAPELIERSARAIIRLVRMNI